MRTYMTRYRIRCMFGESPKEQTKTARWGEDIEIKQKSSSVYEAKKQILKESHNRFQKKSEHAQLINKIKELEERVEELEKLLKKQNINSDCSVESDDSNDSNDSDYVM